jgi:hypothetical protein
MYPGNSSGIRFKFIVAFFINLLIAGSCKKDDAPADEDDLLVRKEDTLKNYSPEVSFNITGRLLEGKRIDCIELHRTMEYIT